MFCPRLKKCCIDFMSFEEIYLKFFGANVTHKKTFVASNKYFCLILKLFCHFVSVPFSIPQKKVTEKCGNNFFARQKSLNVTKKIIAWMHKFSMKIEKKTLPKTFNCTSKIWYLAIIFEYRRFLHLSSMRKYKMCVTAHSRREIHFLLIFFLCPFTY